LFRKLKAASNEDRDALLQNLAFEDHLPRDGLGHAETRDDTDADGSSKLSTMSLEVTSEGSLLQFSLEMILTTPGSSIFYGPTSVYQRDLCALPELDSIDSDSAQGADSASLSQSSPQDSAITDALITKTLSLFLAHQYYQCQYIDYDTFLADHQQNAYGGRYCSTALLYSMCALGSRMSLESSVQAAGVILFQTAQEMLGDYNTQQSDVSSIQAHLCLAVYELDRGSHTIGWLRTGEVLARDIPRVKLIV
jgi:hypothetical protein